jgi:hypothetical protein
MFKNQITLKINKRLKTEKDKIRLAKLKEAIFESKDIVKTFEKFGLNLVHDMKEVKTMNNVCYFNFRCQKVNAHCHAMAKTENKTVTINKVKYWKGLELVCKEHYKNSKSRLYTNYRYNVLYIDKDKFVVEEPVEKIKYSFKIEMLKHFRLPYANTVDSVQGMTIEDEFTIFDSNTPYTDRSFIWTAISRTDDLSKVHIFVHDKQEVLQLTYAKIRQYFKLKCDGYMRQDRKAGRTWKADDYVTEGWIMSQMEGHDNRCPICHINFIINLGLCDGEAKSNITCDRTNNNLPHIKTNCRLTCLKCNCSKK